MNDFFLLYQLYQLYLLPLHPQPHRCPPRHLPPPLPLTLPHLPRQGPPPLRLRSRRRRSTRHRRARLSRSSRFSAFWHRQLPPEKEKRNKRLNLMIY